MSEGAGPGYVERMIALCKGLGMTVTDEWIAAWKEIEQHNMDIVFREIVKD
jgi:hypothetical protein